MKSLRVGRVWKTTAPVCVLALALASGASAEPPKAAKAPPPKASPAVAAKAASPQPYGYPNGFIERHAQRLGLSDDTVKNIRETVEKSRTENERIRKNVEEAQVELRKLLAADLPDETAVMVQADKITALVGEQRKNQLRALIKVRSLLTPAQRAELDKIRKEQPAPRRGAGGPPPPPHDKKKPPFGAGPQGKPPKPAE